MQTWFFHPPMSNIAFLTFLVSGIAGVLPDLDHVPLVLGFMAEGRPLHFTVLFVSLLGCTCFGGLLVRNVLKKVQKHTNSLDQDLEDVNQHESSHTRSISPLFLSPIQDGDHPTDMWHLEAKL